MTNKIKYYLSGCIVLCALCLLSMGFRYNSENKFFNTDVIVKVIPENGGLTVSVATEKNTTVHFYIFSVEGRLIKELNIYGSKRISITPLEKGIYIYDFFSKDERIKSGKIELK